MAPVSLVIVFAAICVAGAAIIVLLVRNGAARAAGQADAALKALGDGLREQLSDRDRQLAEVKAELAEERQNRQNESRLLSESGAECASLRARLDEQGQGAQARERHIGELNTALTQARKAVEDQAGAYNALHARWVELNSRADEQSKQSAEQLQRFQQMRQEMSDQFKALAGEVLRTESETFSKQNREQVDVLLKPLGEKIAEFQKGLLDDRVELKTQLQTLHATSRDMRQEATNLTRALKGSSQMQGAWGEMVLTSILERSGLREGIEFRVQEHHMAEDGGRLRTDVEVLFPNGEAVIIDSKVSLRDFETYVNAEDDEARATSLRAHIGALHNHVRTLSAKEYHRHAGSGFDFVLMFVPIEAAFAAALNADATLLGFAIERNVFLVTPTTLMTALRTIRNVWQIENRQRNAEEIADRAGKLYDKVVGFLDDMNRIDEQIGRTRKVFDDARSKLSTGNGSVVRQVEKLRELGAKASKQISADWQESEPETSNVRPFLNAPMAAVNGPAVRDGDISGGDK